MDEPRICVASLGAYNAGQLNHVWINALEDEDEIHRQIHAMLKNPRFYHSEEYAIHDYENFGAWKPEEFTSIKDVIKVAQAIDYHGIEFTYWLAYCGDIDHAVDTYANAYIGTYASLKDFCEMLTEGADITVTPEYLASYVAIDLEKMMRDYECLYYIAEYEHGVCIFNP